MKAKEFEMLYNNTIETAKNSLVSIITKMFNENKDNNNELLFKKDTYYAVIDGFCFPQKLFMEKNKLKIEICYDWNDMSTDISEHYINNISLEELIPLCEYINDYF